MVTLTETEIDTRIDALQVEASEVVGRQTEVYSRIVGYFRSLKNWNPGKKNEYRARVEFKPDYQNLPDAEVVATAPKRQSFIPEKATLSKVVAGFGQIK